MGVMTKNNKLVIITEPKSIHVALPQNAGNNLNHETDFIKNEISQLLSKNWRGNNIHKHGKQ